MQTYTVLVVDDEYDIRKDVYNSFFEKKYGDEDFAFKVLHVQTVYEFNNLCSDWKHIDAIFLDAKLDGTWKENCNCYQVLGKIEENYSRKNTPPVFMVSKVWKDEEDLLMEVSVNLSYLKKFGHPSAYYDFKNIVSIVRDADAYLDSYDKEKAQIKLQGLLLHRKLILAEIIKNQTNEKVDAAVILAVTDEKTATYRQFGLNDINDKVLKNDGLVYQITSVEGKKVAFITQKCMGMAEAARVTESAINSFEPNVIIMGGVCAGRADKITIGSIVIPKNIYDYSSGKISSDENGMPVFMRRSEAAHESANMTAFYQYVENNTNARSCISKIQNSYPGPVPEDDKTKRIVTYPMASGPWVVDSKVVFEMIQQQIPHDKFCAIDMESYAVASVSTIHKIPWVVIKTVQDYANGKKTIDESTARAYASYSSAFFIKEHIIQIINAVSC